MKIKELLALDNELSYLLGVIKDIQGVCTVTKPRIVKIQRILQKEYDKQIKNA